MCRCRTKPLLAVLLLLVVTSVLGVGAQRVEVNNEPALLSALSQSLNVSLTASILLTAELTLTASVYLTSSDQCNGGCAISVSGTHRHISISGPKTTVELENVTLSGGSANGGGSVLVTGGATGIFKRVLFSANSAAGNLNGGGAVLVSGKSRAFVSFSEFSGNSASFGGAIEAVGFSNLFVRHSTFYQNTATVAGGAINLIDGSNLLLQQCVISNSAAPIGGAINVAGASASICASNITDNIATIGGQGDAVLSGLNSTVALCHNRTEQVTSVRGGRILYECLSCIPLPGKGRHPRGKGHHPPGVGKHPPRIGHHKSRHTISKVALTTIIHR